jgi:hypothetical protein
MGEAARLLAARVTATVQGGSYVYFGLWALLRRRSYIRTHGLEGQEGWVLRAHALWMILIGSTLLKAVARDRIDETSRRLAMGSATALAVNDAYSIRRAAPIYRVDLGYELGVLGAWATLARRQRR